MSITPGVVVGLVCHGRAVSLSEIGGEPNSPHAVTAGIAGGPEASRSPRKLEALELFSWAGAPLRRAVGGVQLLAWTPAPLGDGRRARSARRRAGPRRGHGHRPGGGRDARAADCSIVALDQSPAMLAGARARFATTSGSPVELVQAEAERLPFPTRALTPSAEIGLLLRYATIRRRRMRALARFCAPAGPSAWSSSASRRSRRRGPPGG